MSSQGSSARGQEVEEGQILLFWPPCVAEAWVGLAHSEVKGHGQSGSKSIEEAINN